MRRVVVHIDRLVLKGVEHGHDVAAALQAELTRLLGEPAVVDRIAAMGTVDRVRAAPMPVPAGTGAKALGAHAARSIVAAGRT